MWVYLTWKILRIYTLFWYLGVLQAFFLCFIHRTALFQQWSRFEMGFWVYQRLFLYRIYTHIAYACVFVMFFPTQIHKCWGIWDETPLTLVCLCIPQGNNSLHTQFFVIVVYIGPIFSFSYTKSMYSDDVSLEKLLICVASTQFRLFLHNTRSELPG